LPSTTRTASPEYRSAGEPLSPIPSTNRRIKMEGLD
jgi:hypothetical protein